MSVQTPSLPEMRSMLEEKRAEIMRLEEEIEKRELRTQPAWLRKDGSAIPVSEMATAHLRNAIMFCFRHQKLNRRHGDRTRIDLREVLVEGSAHYHRCATLFDLIEEYVGRWRPGGFLKVVGTRTEHGVGLSVMW